MKKLKMILPILMIALLGGNLIFAAAVPFAVNNVPPNKEAQADSVPFVLYFDKPAKNDFYFSLANTPDTEYVPGADGINFTIPKLGSTEDEKLAAKNAGYPSTASLGIYFDLQDVLNLSVIFNSQSTTYDNYRLRNGGDGEGLNFLVAYGSDLSAANSALELVEGYGDFNGGEENPNAKNPVLCLHAWQNAPASFVDNGVDVYLGDGTNGIPSLNKGHYVFSMIIRSPKDADGTHRNYFGGQYIGYAIMKLETPT